MREPWDLNLIQSYNLVVHFSNVRRNVIKQTLQLQCSERNSLQLTFHLKSGKNLFRNLNILFLQIFFSTNDQSQTKTE